jgi:hypothetical protein
MSTSAFQIPVFSASAERVLQTSARDWGLSWPLPQRARNQVPGPGPALRVLSHAQRPVGRAGHARHGLPYRALRFAFAI